VLLSPPSEENPSAILDFQRRERVGLEEAVYCAGKSTREITMIVSQFEDRDRGCLLTRLDPDKFAGLADDWREKLDYDPISRTAYFLVPEQPTGPARIAIVSGGTSDARICSEAARTLRFYGKACTLIQDVGVTGLWRLLERVEEIRRHPVVIVVAGMEGALFSVVGGLVGSILIAVPAPNGYGVAENGRVSLDAALSSCAPGLVTVNIDNGYGALPECMLHG